MTHASIGDNNPPEPTPFEAIDDRINDLYSEAKQWLDGDPVTSQKQADAINKLINMIRDAEKEADELRKQEVKPFDEGKAKIQALYAPLIADTKAMKGKTVLALQAAKSALTPWLVKLDAEKQEAARIAREAADAAEREAREAFQKSQSDDLEAREEAERLGREADEAARAATAAENSKAHAKGGAGRATGLRTYHRAEITDMPAFAKWCWERRRPEVDGFFTDLANKMVSQNHEVAATADGLTVHEEKKAV